MQAERIPDDHVTQENASEMLTNVFDMVKQQRRLEHKHHILIFIGVLLPVVLIFLGDTMGWMGMFFVVIPCLCIALAISLVIYGIWRKRNHLPCGDGTGGRFGNDRHIHHLIVGDPLLSFHTVIFNDRNHGISTAKGK